MTFSPPTSITLRMPILFYSYFPSIFRIFLWTAYFSLFLFSRSHTSLTLVWNWSGHSESILVREFKSNQGKIKTDWQVMYGTYRYDNGTKIQIFISRLESTLPWTASPKAQRLAHYPPECIAAGQLPSVLSHKLKTSHGKTTWSFQFLNQKMLH